MSKVVFVAVLKNKLSLSSNTFEKNKKGLIPIVDSAQIVIFVFVTKQIDKMGKGTHFFGQPVYGQQKKSLDPKNC